MLLMMAVMDCLWVSSERRKTSAMALQGSDQGPPYKEGNQYMYIYIYVTAPELFKFVLAIGRMGTVDMTITRSQLFDDGESISVNNVRNRTSVVMVMTKP
jgi:hypothetical protein